MRINMTTKITKNIKDYPHTKTTNMKLFPRTPTKTMKVLAESKDYPH